MKLDVNSMIDTCNWLEKHAVTNRDQQRRVTSKRMVARLIAARLALKACEGDIAASREIMDRTEGKVMQEIMNTDGNRLIEQLEAARQRVLAHDNRITVSQQVIEGTVVSDHTLDTGSSACLPGGRVGRPPGGANQVPSGRVGSMSISPLQSEAE